MCFAIVPFVFVIHHRDVRRGTVGGAGKDAETCSAKFAVIRFWLLHGFHRHGRFCGVFGSALLRYRDTLQLLGGILVIFFGLYIMGVIKWDFLGRYLQINLTSRPLGLFGAVLIGATFAVGWTPCVGPILGSILALAASSGETNSGIVLLTSYSLGLGLPFLLSSLVVQKFSSLLKRFRRSLRVVHVSAGVLLVAAGFLLATGYMTVLNQYALRLTPQWLWSRL